MKKKILITGVNGMLGSAVAQELANTAHGYDLFGIGKSMSNEYLAASHYFKLDLLNLDELGQLLNTLSPDVIIHCAAEVNLTLCEEDQVYADKIHQDVTRVLSSYNRPWTRFIYVSTDSVFDGVTGNYSEDDPVNPLNYYALSKFHGEEAVLQRMANYIIVRTNIYGFKKNKGSSLFEWIATKLGAGETIIGFDDVIFSPLYVSQLASVLSKFLSLEYSGILHTGCCQFISKYQFAVEIAKEFGWNPALVARGNSDNVASKILRPKNTTLDTRKLKEIIGYVPDFKLGIKQLYRDYYNK